MTGLSASLTPSGASEWGIFGMASNRSLSSADTSSCSPASDFSRPPNSRLCACNASASSTLPSRRSTPTLFEIELTFGADLVALGLDDAQPCIKLRSLVNVVDQVVASHGATMLPSHHRGRFEVAVDQSRNKTLQGAHDAALTCFSTNDEQLDRKCESGQQWHDVAHSPSHSLRTSPRVF